MNINGILRDVKIQQDAGWRKLSQSSLKDAVALLLPVANLSNNITDTASRTVNHLVDVAKAFTLSTGVQPRSASINDGWLPETIVGIVKQNNSFAIQPNPVSDQFEILLPVGSYEITVFDALGRLVLKQDTEGVSKVNVRNWQNGIYLVNLLDKTTKVKQHSKVVVQH